MTDREFEELKKQFNHLGEEFGLEIYQLLNLLRGKKQPTQRPKKVNNQSEKAKKAIAKERELVKWRSLLEDRLLQVSPFRLLITYLIKVKRPRATGGVRVSKNSPKRVTSKSRGMSRAYYNWAIGELKHIHIQGITDRANKVAKDKYIKKLEWLKTHLPVLKVPKSGSGRVAWQTCKKATVNQINALIEMD